MKRLMLLAALVLVFCCSGAFAGAAMEVAVICCSIAVAGVATEADAGAAGWPGLGCAVVWTGVAAGVSVVSIVAAGAAACGAAGLAAAVAVVCAAGGSDGHLGAAV